MLILKNFYLKNIAASSKTGDENQAGGYGEGAKMASKSLLGACVTDKITFASGDWTMDFAREEGVELINKYDEVYPEQFEDKYLD